MKWWKILSILILLYVHIAGLLIPIGIGITRIQPFQVKGGEEARFEITTYNADLSAENESQIRSWLKYDDDHLIAAKSVDVSAEDQLTTVFDLPSQLPDGGTHSDLTLILDIPEQGTPVLPRAVYLAAADSAVATTAGWSAINLRGLNVVENMHFPYRSILQETIRNTYFHVSLWMAMMILLTGAVVYSVRNLRSGSLALDSRAMALTQVGFFFGILGVLTGMIWAQYTWGKAWSWDIKQLTTAIALLIYAAYFLLRNSVRDPYRKARLSAVFNIFAFIALIPLLYIIPRMSESLHPGSGGNPAMGGEDLDSTMRMIFYPAIIGWALFGWWLADLATRVRELNILARKY
ncbi:cytochrome c biogenesis protein [Membranicola marinus]|uniref:Cytochrome c biogenesis protein n=1 Tax=Membranihabitans marinus TaxID=1227546 RepID=A0A953HYH4_9BACT|nr:cytochrome c biogenesis protein CcsA [Membranihabitans marinus]MBY5960108.1 cytochrome c biogenesis protein [Membranihabitans marinus]